MADRYFQCAYCKKLTAQDDTVCYVSSGAGVTKGNLTNEVCTCTGAGKRLRELTQAQYNMEAALNRPINNP